MGLCDALGAALSVSCEYIHDSHIGSLPACMPAWHCFCTVEHSSLRHSLHKHTLTQPVPAAPDSMVANTRQVVEVVALTTAAATACWHDARLSVCACVCVRGVPHLQNHCVVGNMCRINRSTLRFCVRPGCL